MKKILSKMLVFALVVCLSGAVSVFAGCQVGGGNGGSTSDYSHTIVFYSSQGDSLQKKTLNAIANFEAKYPGWTVEHTPKGGYTDVESAIKTDIQGDKQPDIAYCYADHVAGYLKSGTVLDLNQYINSTEKVNGYTVGYSAEELADFVEIYWEEGKATNYSNYDKYGYTADSMLTLPFVKSTELLYYNADALVSCGFVDDEGNAKPAETWEELWAQCAQIKRLYPLSTPLGYDSEANWFITMCELNGWGYTSIDSDNHYLFNGQEQIAFLDSLTNYYRSTDNGGLGYITTEEAYGAYTSNLFTQGVANDAPGCVYCIGSSGGASYQKPTGENAFNWGIAPVPGKLNDEGNVVRKAISQGPSLVMFESGYGLTSEQKAEKQKMTFMFLKELLDATFQAEFAQTSGYNAVRKSVVNDKDYQKFIAKADTDIIAKAILVGQEMVDDYFVSPAFLGSSTARVQVGEALLYVMKGEKTGERALQDAYNNCKGIK